MTDPGAILRVLADLAPDRRTPGFDVSGKGPTAMAWIPFFDTTNDTGDPFVAAGVPVHPTTRRSEAVEVLARFDALSPGAALRIGWLWIVGTAVVDGTPQRILLPLLSRPARVVKHLVSTKVEPLGAWDLWPLVTDAATAAALEADASFGGGAIDLRLTQELLDRMPLLRQWVDRAVEAAGLPPVRRLVAGTDPRHLHPGSNLEAVAGFGLYAESDVDPTRPQETLRSWSTDPGVAASAFARLYLGSTPTTGEPTDESVASAFPLTDRQHEVVLAARTEPVVVVSGPPGTGKSQTAAAIALDAVARGKSVLLAAQSRAAADVVADLLDRVPGPTPVLFGGGERASRLAARLADGLGTGPVDTAAARHAAAEDLAADLGRATIADLDALVADARWRTEVLTLAGHALVAPRLLDDDATVTADDASALLARCRPTTGWWASRRRGRAERRLRRLVGAPEGTDLETLARAVELAALRTRAGRAAGRSTVAASARWAALEEADRARRIGRAEALADEVAGRAGPEERRAVAALAAALRSGRAERRSHLAAIRVGDLTQALPLWVGTLGEIESLLPATAAAFDLVILDEASQIDQLTASAALLRAKQAVIIGDPRQLRFVSFVADGDVRSAIAAHDCRSVADRLDVRRVSAFDLAASAAPVRFLDEHFRSVPHLIGFSAGHFYEGRLLVATRHPTNECIDAIDVIRVDGTRRDGVNVAEVDEALRVVHELLADVERPHDTIGIVSPYRDQVERIRERVGAEVPIEVLQTERIRVGTVHGFQGAECDVAIASFGLSDAEGRGRRFLEDPNLFNVLVTRARRRQIVLASIDDPPPGLLADYLHWAEHGLAPVADAAPTDEWTSRLAQVLRDAGTPVRTGYPVGRWSIDLVVGTGQAAVAVATTVHPDGPAAHIRRHLALARAGWVQAEAFVTDHDGDAVATALALGDLR